MDQESAQTEMEATQAETVASAPVAAKPRSMPKWEETTRERVKTAIKKFAKPLNDLVERDANEGDTRLLVTDFLCDCLGYNKYDDLTTEYAVKGEFADYGIRIDKDLVAFIEVKRINTKLGKKHLRQAEMYALNEGLEWIVLTNGAEWQVYHITAGVPVLVELASSVNLLGDEPPSHKAKQMFYLTRESLKRRQIDDLWKARRATSPDSLGKVLRSDAVLGAIAKELRHQTGHRLDLEDLRQIMDETILRPDCLQK